MRFKQYSIQEHVSVLVTRQMVNKKMGNISDITIMLVLYIIVHLHLALGCGYEERPATLVGQVEQADVVLFGTINGHIPQRNIGKGAYTARMDVYCIFKGGPLPRKINITDAGFIPPGCLQTDLDVGKDYIVTLERLQDGRLRPLDRERLYTEEVISQLSLICDVDIQIPTDVSVDGALFECPSNPDPSTCKRESKVEVPTERPHRRPTTQKPEVSTTLLLQPESPFRYGGSNTTSEPTDLLLVVNKGTQVLGNTCLWAVALLSHMLALLRPLC